MPYITANNNALTQFVDVPKGFVFPNAQQYSVDLGNALNIVQPMFLTGGQGAVEQIYSVAKGSLLTPIKAQVAMMSSTFEGATGVSVDDVFSVAGAIASLAMAKTPQAIIGSIRDLIAGGLKIITAVAGTALGVTAAALQSIPVVGTVISAVLAVVAFVFDIFAGGESDEELLKDCRGILAPKLEARCRAMQDRYAIVSTRSAGPTPADLFRPVAFALFDKRPLPPTTIASMYVALCASETPFNGSWYGAVAGERVADCASDAFKLAGDCTELGPFVSISAYPDSGLPKSVKQAMWSLIKSILSSVDDPNNTDPSSKYDGGRGAYAMLQEIVRYQYRGVQKIGNDTFLGMAAAINSKHYETGWQGYRYSLVSDPKEAYCASPCEKNNAKLANAFRVSLAQYEDATFQQFYRDGKWSLVPYNPNDIMGRSVAKPAVVNSLLMNDKLSIKTEARLRAIGLVPPPINVKKMPQVVSAKISGIISAKAKAEQAAQKAALLRKVGTGAAAVGAGAAVFALLRGL